MNTGCWSDRLLLVGFFCFCLVFEAVEKACDGYVIGIEFMGAIGAVYGSLQVLMGHGVMGENIPGFYEIFICG